MNAKCALALAVAALTAFRAAAAPLEFNEISLLVRLHEPESYIVQQVKNRSLLRALTAREETMLTAQGAPEGLLQALRDPVLAMSPDEAKEYVAQREQLKLALQQRDAAERQAAAALAARAPAVPPRAPAVTDDPDVPSPIYYHDGGGYGGYGYGRDRRSHREFSGQPLPAARAPASPFVPSGPSGAGDRTVHALSSNAIFVPSR